jgi:hypothetical protein
MVTLEKRTCTSVYVKGPKGNPIAARGDLNQEGGGRVRRGSPPFQIKARSGTTFIRGQKCGLNRQFFELRTVSIC